MTKWGDKIIFSTKGRHKKSPRDKIYFVTESDYFMTKFMSSHKFYDESDYNEYFMMKYFVTILTYFLSLIIRFVTNSC